MAYSDKCCPEKPMRISVKAKKQAKRNKQVAKKIENFLNWYCNQPEIKEKIKEAVRNQIFSIY